MLNSANSTFARGLLNNARALVRNATDSDAKLTKQYVAVGQRNELFAYGERDNELLTKEFDGAGKFFRDEQGRIAYLIYYEGWREMGLARKIC